jgi:predicted GNAT family acetyltransferase
MDSSKNPEYERSGKGRIMIDQTKIEEVQKKHGFASEGPEELMRAAKREARIDNWPEQATSQKKAALKKKTITGPAAAGPKVTK